MIKLKPLEERFTKLIKVRGIQAYDTRHAWDEFQAHFPHLTFSDFAKFLTHGIVSIIEDFDKKIGNYMIISKSEKVRIPVEIRDDRYTKEIIAAVPTVLGEKELINLRGEVEVYIENKQYRRFPLYEGFNFYTQSGALISDFQDVYID